jgi:hypothetical protein
VKSLRRFRPEAAKDPMLHKAMAEAADPCSTPKEAIS